MKRPARALLTCLFLFSAARTYAQPNTPPDTLFRTPYIDVDEWRDLPVRHRYVHGGFTGTQARFSFYFPPKEAYQGRFFQYITPFPDSETLSQGATGEEDKIGFSIASGAYFVETNGGGRIDFSKPGFANDPTIGAYRANAAAARYSREVAARFFGPHRPYGYCFGGSGGAYRTIGGLENTMGVWDGAVPYVLGSPMAIPNVFSVRMHAMRILRDKLPAIIDALEPGGSGDPYAGLNAEETEALREVTRMGFPPKSWFGYKTMGVHGFVAVYQGMTMADRGYFTDFWNVPGYLGAAAPPSLLKARMQHRTTLTRPIATDEAVQAGLMQAPSATERGTADAAWKSMGGAAGTLPVAFQLATAPPAIEFLGGDLLIKSGAAAGKTLQLTKVAGNTILLGPADPSVLMQLKPGDTAQVDNSNFLAAQTYHRHQVPGAEYPVWNQFRGADGKPTYPQRPMLLGPLFTRGAAGVLPTGTFRGKMILLESLWDREAFPWQADWYRTKVKAHLGDSTDAHFRLWYTDRALHGDLSKQEDPTRTVSYLGVLQQALRDLSAWVERGTPPAPTTTYTIADGQVNVPTTAAARRGIQPVVAVRANGNERADVQAGKSVVFTAQIELPPGTGTLVEAHWDFDGTGTFATAGKLMLTDKGGSRATLKTTYPFTKPGTYFPTLRVASQRQGDAKTPYARIQNLGRVRVVVQ
jgi:hypothetical protein